ncbi:DUF397 domain-containing protein [Spirillospora sp. NPDC049652]
MDVTKLEWRKSSRSHADGDQCVELAGAPGGVAVRDSKDPDGGYFLVGRDALSTALRRIRSLGQEE